MTKKRFCNSKYVCEIKKKTVKSLLQEAELPQFTIMGWETNERKIKLATGTYQVCVIEYRKAQMSSSWGKKHPILDFVLKPSIYLYLLIKG